ncbi:threonine--tRNA ligase [Neomoorella thermoacetica]|uniref:Threonine--tRNA ligase n=1 Tax=Moorella thermoacetica (strain ATCC 39073 / JCM 9320) TaxID=264732 RepID=Q2RHM9_MOOTA|nr:threonine--tRNA ligase [Moorella thermoacetica]AKX94565.1 threonine--tRNA ligase 2 [Moorella thermoacetica]AKX97201.1 threonine--tRNA ligase 2 [Moorella thermoacetica]OIQ11858.1 threonine--tRNA ligase 2 [Moorella thermoacetica]OIQ55094.1 threonine--tRNA ligase 2 [Moorella thermoacetica]OIQ57380.1 threonine--tRNA ligase 2 [Moorella thermoacetica]
MRITLPDGTVKEYAPGTTALQVARDISPRLAREALAARVNGEVWDLTRPLPEECQLELLTFADEGGRLAYRHTAAHVLAQAVKHLFPGTELGIGPAITDGFYYDFDSEHKFTPEDLTALEAEMQRIIKADLPLERREVSREEALELFRRLGEPYKVELINDLPEGVPISTYRQGDFIDLCAGPHLPSTGYLKAVKLTSLAGAYWRGSERNPMLQRIYGTAFPKAKDLEEYLHRLEEARKRDHRRLGAQLGIFSLHEEGPGFPFFHHKGMIIRNELEQFWREEHRRAGYLEIRTPVILSRTLWEQSGHWDHYRENMYFTKIDGADYAIKPMNCPGAILVYKTEQHSYRDLPLRLAELGLVHRHEKSGVLHGLMRVRAFTQDDSHIFMLPSQIASEIQGVIDLVDRFYNLFGFKYHVELSTRPDNAMGSEEIWETATSALRQALEAKGMPYAVNEGDGAFYGPKIDFHLEDSLGRTWQCGTIQLDFLMPEKFDLTYIGEDGQKHRPVMIHRVVFGSIERFIGILIEHYGGSFPVWLAPVQVRVLPITDRHNDYAFKVRAELIRAGIRAEVNDRNDKIGYKIRAAQMEHIPYMLVVGDKEAAEGTVAVRERQAGDTGRVPLAEFIARVTREISRRE